MTLPTATMASLFYLVAASGAGPSTTPATAIQIDLTGPEGTPLSGCTSKIKIGTSWAECKDACKVRVAGCLYDIFTVIYM